MVCLIEYNLIKLKIRLLWSPIPDSNWGIQALQARALTNFANETYFEWSSHSDSNRGSSDLQSTALDHLAMRAYFLT